MSLQPQFQPTVAHRRRLRELWRSAGWPCRDTIEAELLAAGCLTSQRDAAGHETVRLTPAGVALIADTLRQNRQRRDPHEALTARVARQMQHAGRLVWCGLSLRAWVSSPARGSGAQPALRVSPPTDLLTSFIPPGAALQSVLPGLEPAVSAGAAPEPAGSASMPEAPGDNDRAGPGRWVLAMPDVFSIRHTSVEQYLAPVAHEVKVRRADLLSDLRNPAKAEAYRWLAGECWYVIREGIAEPHEIPDGYGVMVAPPAGPLLVARQAPRRERRLPFAVWMALAKAMPLPADNDQAPLSASPDESAPWADWGVGADDGTDGPVPPR